MILVEAALLRGGVYFAGECVRCAITFTNTARPPRVSASAEWAAEQRQSDEALPLSTVPSQSANGKSKVETIAWATAQVHCHVSYNPNLVRVPSEYIASASSVVPSITTQTALAAQAKEDHGFSVFATPPTILFCDLELAAGEAKTFEYVLRLPATVPPSHSGHALKYSYKVVVGAQKVNAAASLLRLPFRVFCIGDKLGGIEVGPEGNMDSGDRFRPDALPTASRASSIVGDTEPSPLSSRSPSVHEDLGAKGLVAGRGRHNGHERQLSAASDSSRDTASFSMDGGPSQLAVPSLEQFMEALMALLARHQAANRTSMYGIGRADASIARFRLTKTVYKLGDDIVGEFDFSLASLPCFQVSVILESEETIADGMALAAKPTVRQVAAEHRMFCRFARTTHFIMAVPLSGSPDFETDLVRVRWRLRFEFVAGSSSSITSSGSMPAHIVVDGGIPVMLSGTVEHDSARGMTSWRAPHSSEVETLAWSLPIKVLPAHPATTPLMATTASLKM